jgi:hypothetical protein
LSHRGPLHTYRFCGLVLESSLALPCRRAAARVRVDVRLRRGTPGEFARARAEAGAPSGPRDWFHTHALPDGSRYLRWTGLFEFLVSPDGRQILYRKLADATPASFGNYLLGQVLSFSLLKLGIEPLHGTAVVVGRQAVAFVGSCGSGKSTIGAAMLARGHPILTDDLVVLRERRGRWMAHPGIPRLKLVPSVARRLLERVPRGTRLNPGTAKLILPLGSRQACARIVPLGAVYVLSSAGRRRRAGGVRITPLAGHHAVIEVIRAAFNLLDLDRDRLAAHFDFAGRVAGAVPVRRLTYPRRLSSLAAVCDRVVADLAPRPH